MLRKLFDSSIHLLFTLSPENEQYNVDNCCLWLVCNDTRTSTKKRAVYCIYRSTRKFGFLLLNYMPQRKEITVMCVCLIAYERSRVWNSKISCISIWAALARCALSLLEVALANRFWIADWSHGANSYSEKITAEVVEKSSPTFIVIHLLYCVLFWSPNLSLKVRVFNCSMRTFWSRNRRLNRMVEASASSERGKWRQHASSTV